MMPAENAFVAVKERRSLSTDKSKSSPTILPRHVIVTSPTPKKSKVSLKQLEEIVAVQAKTIDLLQNRLSFVTISEELTPQPILLKCETTNTFDDSLSLTSSTSIDGDLTPVQLSHHLPTQIRTSSYSDSIKSFCTANNSRSSSFFELPFPDRDPSIASPALQSFSEEPFGGETPEIILDRMKSTMDRLLVDANVALGLRGVVGDDAVDGGEKMLLTPTTDFAPSLSSQSPVEYPQQSHQHSIQQIQYWSSFFLAASITTPENFCTPAHSSLGFLLLLSLEPLASTTSFALPSLCRPLHAHRLTFFMPHHIHLRTWNCNLLNSPWFISSLHSNPLFFSSFVVTGKCQWRHFLDLCKNWAPASILTPASRAVEDGRVLSKAKLRNLRILA